jgi:hypothetical protein
MRLGKKLKVVSRRADISSVVIRLMCLVNVVTRVKTDKSSCKAVVSLCVDVEVAKA